MCLWECPCRELEVGVSMGVSIWGARGGCVCGSVPVGS